jgi:hypothetical protein
MEFVQALFNVYQKKAWHVSIVNAIVIVTSNICFFIIILVFSRKKLTLDIDHPCATHASKPIKYTVQNYP